jgi:hypothetical protein
MLGIEVKSKKRRVTESRDESDDKKALRKAMIKARGKDDSRWLAPFLADIGLRYLDKKFGKYFYELLEKLIKHKKVKNKKSAKAQLARVRDRLGDEQTMTNSEFEVLLGATKKQVSAFNLVSDLHAQVLAQLANTKWGIWGRTPDGTDRWVPTRKGIGGEMLSMLPVKERAEYFGKEFEDYFDKNSSHIEGWLKLVKLSEKQIIATKMPYKERLRALGEVQSIMDAD